MRSPPTHKEVTRVLFSTLQRAPHGIPQVNLEQSQSETFLTVNLSTIAAHGTFTAHRGIERDPAWDHVSQRLHVFSKWGGSDFASQLRSSLLTGVIRINDSHDNVNAIA